MGIEAGLEAGRLGAAARIAALPAVLAAVLHAPVLLGALAPSDAEWLGLPPYDRGRLWTDAIRTHAASPETEDSPPAAASIRRALGLLQGGAPAALHGFAIVLLAAAAALVRPVLRTRGAAEGLAHWAAIAFALHPSHVAAVLSSDGAAALLAVVLTLGALVAAQDLRGPSRLTAVVAIGTTAVLADASALALPAMLLADAVLFGRARESVAVALATLGSQYVAGVATGTLAFLEAPALQARLPDLIAIGSLGLTQMLFPWTFSLDAPMPSGLGFQYGAALIAGTLTLAVRSGRTLGWCAFAAAAWCAAGVAMPAAAPRYAETALVFPSLAVCVAVAMAATAGLSSARATVRRATAACGLIAALASVWTVLPRLAEASAPCRLAAAGVRRQPTSPEWLRHDAICALTGADYARAETRAAALAGSRPEGYVLLAQARWRLVRAEASVAAVAEALKKGVGFVDAPEPALGALLAVARGRFDDAETLARKAAAAASDEDAALLLLARIAHGRGRIEDALRFGRARLARAPQDAAARAWIAEVLAGAGRSGEARALMRDGISVAPSQVGAYAAAILFELRHGTAEEAVAVADGGLLRGVRLDGGALATSLQAALRADRLGRAGPLLLRLRERNPRDDAAAVFEALRLRRQGSAAEADTLMAAVRARNPGLHLGPLLASLEGQREPATAAETGGERRE